MYFKDSYSPKKIDKKIIKGCTSEKNYCIVEFNCESLIDNQWGGDIDHGK